MTCRGFSNILIAGIVVIGSSGTIYNCSTTSTYLSAFVNSLVISIGTSYCGISSFIITSLSRTDLLLLVDFRTVRVPLFCSEIVQGATIIVSLSFGT